MAIRARNPEVYYPLYGRWNPLVFVFEIHNYIPAALFGNYIGRASRQERQRGL